MLTGFCDGELILEERAARSRNRRLSGKFKYNNRATLSDGGRTGRPRKEEFAPRAFSYNIDAGVDIRLLIGHSYDRPLASVGSRTLILKDSDEALSFEAYIAEEMQETSWWKDFLAAYNAGLVRGLSPGFRLPPERAVAEAEEVYEEDPKEGIALIRRILQALLYEISLVTSAAYPDTEVEARNWTPTAGGVLVPEAPDAGLHRALNRWRA